MKPRFIMLAWVLMFVVASYGLYRVKYQVLSIRSEIAQTTRSLQQERENLHAAAAEWAYLTRPERLERLSEKYLHLQPMQPNQVADIKGLDTRLQPNRTVSSVQVVPAALHTTVATPREEE